MKEDREEKEKEEEEAKSKSQEETERPRSIKSFHFSPLNAETHRPFRAWHKARSSSQSMMLVPLLYYVLINKN